MTDLNTECPPPTEAGANVSAEAVNSATVSGMTDDVVVNRISFPKPSGSPIFGQQPTTDALDVAEPVDSGSVSTDAPTNENADNLQSIYEDTKMADISTPVVLPTGDNFMGGNSMLGGLILGSILNGTGILGRGAVGAAALGADVGYNALQQSLNQNQLASATQILTQDINRIGHDVATSAAATQATVLSQGTQGMVATMQGQNALTQDILSSTLTNTQGHANIMNQVSAAANDVNAQVNNARQNISDDIRESTRVLDMDLHNLGQSIDRSIEGVRNDVNRTHIDMINATHHAEVTGLRSAFETQKTITDDGDKTRALITNINTADLNRQIAVTEAKLAEALGDRRHLQSTHDIIINNNNNNTAVANALAQQQQQQRMDAVLAAVAGLTGNVNTMTQLTLNTGNGARVGAIGTQV